MNYYLSKRYVITNFPYEGEIDCDGIIKSATVIADDKTIMKRGKFII